MAEAAPTALTPEGFAAEVNVSRETLARLRLYAGLLEKWQKAINLVGRSTLPDLWRRHMLDSAQLQALAPPAATTWVDLGSGAGFPGLVLAILGVGTVHLIESDSRKCTFLREVARQTATAVAIHNCRIEAVAPFRADVITARALAPLGQLLDWGSRFAGADTIGLFLKGQDAENELTLAAKSWTIPVERLPSRSDPSGTVLRVKGFSRA